MSKETYDIFDEVQETEVKKSYDPARVLFNLPEEGQEGALSIKWFVPKERFGVPKEINECTRSLFVRFLSWQLREDTRAAYRGTGTNDVGVLRNQFVVRFHSVPDNYLPGFTGRGRVPCGMMFGDTCIPCQAAIKANSRYSRDASPRDYFGKVIAPLKSRNSTIMVGEIYTGANDAWEKDKVVNVFEFTNYINGTSFTKLIDNRANDADKRIRIDKKSYAGYVNPVVLKITYTWPVKDGRVDRSQFATWKPIDVTPFPVEAGGPNVQVADKEWALKMAKLDPAAWVNQEAFPDIDFMKVEKWLQGRFDGVAADVDHASFGELLGIVNSNRERFDALNVNVADFDISMIEALREIVRGVLNG